MNLRLHCPPPSRRSPRGVAGLVRLLLLLLLSTPWRAAAATGRSGIAATGHPLATEAAVEALKNGGNAIDAAVAAALTLGVVDGHNSGLGGGCFLLLRLADGSVIAIDGREQAPAAARKDLFLREGRAQPRLSQTGALASGVPGALAAYQYALEHYGKISLRTHLALAAQMAENGFALSQIYAHQLAATAADLRQFEASRALFFHPDGALFHEGDLFRQPDLAKSYRAIAEQGSGWFYAGPLAEAADRWMKANGGLMTAQDFKAYQIKLREPLRTRYRDCEIIGFPPPSSGGVHVAQILNILEHFDLKKLGAQSADFVHLVSEAMKLAFADRAYWLGDADFAAVPRGLVSPAYGARLARKINLKRATPVPHHDTPERAEEDLFNKHTTHFSTADAAGNWVAGTATINTSFGSKVVIPGTGVVLNNQMDDFSIQPGVANAFGLVGAEANSVAPGKRPLSSMSPTIVLRGGKPILAVGAAGGPTIISQTLLTLLYVIDFGMPLEQALAQPRFHQQWQPDQLTIERGFREEVRRELARRGHAIKLVDAFGVTQAVSADSRKSIFTGVADPRAEGQAQGF